MSTIRTALPAAFHAGDTLKFLTTSTDHPASAGWGVELILVNSLQRYTATSAAQGDDHLITVSAATTADWLPGNYTARLRVIKAGEAYTLLDQAVTVHPGLAAPADGRSAARRMLEAIEATLEKRASDDVLSYQIAGRELRRHSMTDLLKLRDRLRAEVLREESAERARAGLQPKGRIAVRFSR